MLFEWIIPDQQDLTLRKPISSSYKIPSIIESILISRNINSEDKLERYLKPKLSDLYDPFLMKDMEKAVNRIINALQVGENILIYGDYDVDGVTGVSILYDSLHRIGGKVSFYIPDRNTDGYGVSKSGINKAKQTNVSLLITVDCGITANEEISYASSLGIDTIICDHHEVVGSEPEAYAVLDPKLNNCGYPFKELAGCGVAFKLLQALCTRLDIKEEFAFKYLDLVALGTAADIVTLLDENRILVNHGLKKINTRPRYGMSALIRICGLSKQQITVSLIVFMLAPRLNAVGRISNAKKAVHLLTSNSPQQAKNIAQILDSENNKRKNIDELTLKEAEQIITDQIDLEKAHVLVLAKENWHLGVIGIVASRILEKYNRPTVLISINDGFGKASARSAADFNIFSAFKELENLLISYGGHKCAAGLTIKKENISVFAEKINDIAKNSVKLSTQLPKLFVDAEISLNDYNAEFLKWLKFLSPFGPDNMRPVFVSKNLDISGPIHRIGSHHLKFKVKQNGVVIDTIAYNMDKYLSEIEKTNKINCAYVIEESNWNGQTTIQLRIKDFEVANG
ncbi:MAG: single-stranded-DNA-specific exonuclease RecJ [Calditrichaeota bacterium]|nr:single-stranded-DNA-specific exonuclease RecJ [Calditrichota bacterium]